MASRYLLRAYDTSSVFQPDCSCSSLHSIFLGGLTLLHAVHTDPTVMPHREVSKAVRATSNALFAYSQQFKIGEVLHEAFEDLASASLERLANPPAVRNQPILSDQDTNDWQDELARMSSTMSAPGLLCSRMYLLTSFPRHVYAERFYKSARIVWRAHNSYSTSTY